MIEGIASTFVAALVNGASKKIIDMITAAFDKENTGGQAQADKAIKKFYSTLQKAFNDNCVRVLKEMEYGQRVHAGRIRQLLYGDLKSSNKGVGPLEAELNYRLKYMRMHGVLVLVGDTEYQITNLGKAFLNEARRHREYIDVLSGS